MSNAHLTLQRLSGELEACLATMSQDELRERLLHHARGLPSAERAPFLAIFRTPRATVRTSSASASTPLVGLVEDDPLLDESDEFVDRLRSGDYVHGFGWDPEIHDQRAFGDEGWVWEMDGFLDAANRAFASGRLGLARAAYERLLGAFALDEEVGAFCGALPPTEMISTDLGEAEARYLRSVYETTAPEERAEPSPAHGSPCRASICRRWPRSAKPESTIWPSSTSSSRGGRRPPVVRCRAPRHPVAATGGHADGRRRRRVGDPRP